MTGRSTLMSSKANLKERSSRSAAERTLASVSNEKDAYFTYFQSMGVLGLQSGRKN